MAKVKPKYRATLDKYLRWFAFIEEQEPSNILHHTFAITGKYVEEDPTAESPEIIMRDWESQGSDIPDKCSDPLQLCRYIRGKKERDRQIHEWIIEIELGTMFKQEFTAKLLKLGENPARIFQGVRNNYQDCYAKQWHTLVVNNVDPYAFFDNLEQTSQEWQTIHSVLQ